MQAVTSEAPVGHPTNTGNTQDAPDAQFSNQPLRGYTLKRPVDGNRWTRANLW